MLNPTVQSVNKSDGAAGYLLRMLLIFAIALYVFEALYGLIDGVDDGTGLFGYLIGLELTIFFGHTFAFLNFLFVFLFLAAHLLGGIFFMAALADSRSGSRRALSALLLAVPLLLSSLAAYGIEAWGVQRDQAAPVSKVDLDVQPSAPALHQGLIELAGWRDQRDAIEYSYAVTGKLHDIEVSLGFVPVVAKGWTPAAPIRYLVRYHGSLNGWPRKKQTETGKLTRHLPYYVLWQLRARHLKIDPSYAVIEPRQADERYLVLIFGLLWSLPSAIGICIFYARG